jgi:hypothetical protein
VTTRILVTRMRFDVPSGKCSSGISERECHRKHVSACDRSSVCLRYVNRTNANFCATTTAKPERAERNSTKIATSAYKPSDGPSPST